MKKICPMSIGEYITCEAVDYANNTVTMTYGVSEGMLDFEALRANEETFRNNMLVGYANNHNTEAFKKLLQYIVDADANMQMIFKCEGEEPLTLLFTADEIKKVLTETDGDAEQLLQLSVDNARLQTPMTIDEGIVMTDVVLDANNCTYVYSCDESLYDFDVLNENIGVVKQALLEELSPNDPAIKQLLDLLSATHRGLVYQYVGTTSGKTCTVYFSVEELL